MDLKGKKIVFLGDSITEGCGTSGVEHHFVTLVGKEGGFRESKNYGIGGTRIARQTKPSDCENWDKDFCARVEELDEDADIIGVSAELTTSDTATHLSEHSATARSTPSTEPATTS